MAIKEEMVHPSLLCSSREAFGRSEEFMDKDLAIPINIKGVFRMSGICPVCNGLKEVYVHCDICQQLLVDKGKISDQLDPYSPYVNTDGQNEHSQDCSHYLICPNCHASNVLLVQEWKL